MNTPNQYSLFLGKPEHAFQVHTAILSPKLVQVFKLKQIKWKTVEYLPTDKSSLCSHL